MEKDQRRLLVSDIADVEVQPLDAYHLCVV
jgi:hypothetical protein